MIKVLNNVINDAAPKPFCGGLAFGTSIRMFYFLLIVVAFMLRANSFMHSGMVKASFRGIPLSRRSMMFAPEWTEGFNRFHLREAVKELQLAGKLSLLDDKKNKSAVKKKIKGWTLPCYELDASKTAVPVTSLWPESKVIAKDFVGKEIKEVSTAFLGVDHRFGRPDKGDKPILFETLVFKRPGAVSYGRYCSTYDEAIAQHKEVCQMVVENKIDFSVEM